MSGRGLLGWPTWVGVVVEDLDAQRRFWGELLGEPGSDSGPDYVQFDMGHGRSFELIERSEEPPALRELADAVVVLLVGREDDDIIDFFIRALNAIVARKLFSLPSI